LDSIKERTYVVCTETDKRMRIKEDIVSWSQTEGGRSAGRRRSAKVIRVKGERIFGRELDASKEDCSSR